MPCAAKRERLIAERDLEKTEFISDRQGMPSFWLLKA